LFELKPLPKWDGVGNQSASRQENSRPPPWAAGNANLPEFREKLFLEQETLSKMVKGEKKKSH
jgi:hypothetical protein